MKRILVLILGFMFVLQLTAFAEIRKESSNDSTTISSYLYVKNEKDKTVFNSYAYTWRVYGRESKTLGFWISLENEKNKTIMYSKKNPPIFEIVKDGQKTTFLPSKIENIGTDDISFDIKKGELKDVYAADKVFIVYPTKDNSTIKYEIPKAILSEWEIVFNTDMKQLKKELMN
jgi:hypothetical protein